MNVLVVNAGSSSVRLRVLDGDDLVVADAHLEGWDPDGVAAFVDANAADVGAVGHRVVHGGGAFDGPVVVDAAAEAAIEALVPLARLHQPVAIDGIRLVRERLGPGVPAVACFDTAFHRTMPAAASTYALPAAWRARWDLRRFGFHGLSHAYASRRAGELLGEGTARVVVCHLGAGASLCATVGGRSVDTTMGFSPLEGLVMATRSGSVDPGLVLWLIAEAGVPVAEVERGLRSAAGLAGLAGGDGDLRDVLARAEAGDAAAGLAVDVYLHRLVSAIGAMVASLGGLDALVFTGGVGEHQPVVRAAAVARLAFLGLDVDGARNRSATDGTDVDVTTAGSRGPAVLVIGAREDLEIARSVRSLLG